MTKIILALAISLVPMFAVAQVVKETGVPCSVLTKDATTQERKYCSKMTVEDYCKAMTVDTTTMSRKLCEKKAVAAEAASAPASAASAAK